MIALLALLATAQPTTPAPPSSPAAVEQSRIVAIPFNPPLDRQLTYRFTTTETRRGSPISVSLLMRVRLRREGAGFVLTMSSEVPPGIPRAHPLYAALARPFEFRVSAGGEITELVDEAGYWRLMDGVMGDLLRGMGDDDPGARAARAALEQLRRLPTPDRLAVLARHIVPLLEFSSVEMRVGESVESRIAAESVLGPLEQDVTITLEGIEGGLARFGTRVRLPPGQMTRLMDEVTRRYGAPGQSAGAAAEALPPERHDRHWVSLASGLTERYESRIMTLAREEGASPSPLKTITLELLRP